MGKADLKAVVLRSTGAAANVKEVCVLEDKFGSSMIHIWESLVHTLTTGNSYTFTNLTVRNFQGSTYLSTSPSTTAIPMSQTVETLTGPDMLKSPEKEITATKFNFLSKLNIFCSCKVCKRRLNNSFTCTTLKCENCGTQKSSYQMDSLVGKDRWRDLSTGSVAREDTLLWEQTSFNVPIRETGMPPFLRVSKVRVHESSITLNSTNVALSVNYIII